jgi:hypothetical protein
MRRSHFESSKTGMRPAHACDRAWSRPLDLPRNRSNGPEFHSSLRRYQRYEELERARQGGADGACVSSRLRVNLEWVGGSRPFHSKRNSARSRATSRSSLRLAPFSVRRAAGEMEGRQIWIRFATGILLALEFALAADLVRTAVAPTWDDIAKLAVIATIRTMAQLFPGQGHRRIRFRLEIHWKSAL